MCLLLYSVSALEGEKVISDTISDIYWINVLHYLPLLCLCLFGMTCRVLPEASWPRRWVKPVLWSGCEAPPASPPAPRSESSRLQEPPKPPAAAIPREELSSVGCSGRWNLSSLWSCMKLHPGWSMGSWSLSGYWPPGALRVPAGAWGEIESWGIFSSGPESSEESACQTDQQLSVYKRPLVLVWVCVPV